MMSLTCRPHTPPLPFWSVQNIWLAFVSGPARGAKTPERSVRTPSVIVLSVIPGPALIEPEDPLEVFDEPLLPHAASDTATTRHAARTRRERLMLCSLSYWFGCLGTGGSDPRGHPRRRSERPPPRRRTGSGQRPRTAGRCCRGQRPAGGCLRNETGAAGGRSRRSHRLPPRRRTRAHRGRSSLGSRSSTRSRNCPARRG